MLAEAQRNPACDVCHIMFKSMETLSIHRKNVHGKTDSMRLTRFENAFKSALKKESTIEVVLVDNKLKNFDCSE